MSVDSQRIPVFDPHEHLVIVGRDTPDGPGSPGYDVRGLEEPDEVLAASLGRLGQLENILVVRNGPKYHVVAGRRRVLAARLWNEAHDQQKILLRGVVVRGWDDARQLEATIAENELRKPDAPINKARKAQRLIDHGRSTQEICAAFGCSQQLLDSWLELLDLSPEVQAQIDREEIAAAQARELVDWPHADQTTVVQISEETKEPVRRVARALAPGSRRRWEPVTKRRTKSEIEDAIEDITIQDGAVDWRHALRWAIGGVEELVPGDDE